MSYSWFQTSQTGGQQYSDTSLFSIPWIGHKHHLPFQPREGVTAYRCVLSNLTCLSVCLSMCLYLRVVSVCLPVCFTTSLHVTMSLSVYVFAFLCESVICFVWFLSVSLSVSVNLSVSVSLPASFQHCLSVRPSFALFLKHPKSGKRTYLVVKNESYREINFYKIWPYFGLVSPF